MRQAHRVFEAKGEPGGLHARTELQPTIELKQGAGWSIKQKELRQWQDKKKRPARPLL
jgi:hypothetical protein